MRLLQMTDLHLLDETEEKSGENNNNFLKVINFLKNNLLYFKIDHIVITGDISHDGSKSSYDYFFYCINQLDFPFSFLHGNHDNIETLDLSKNKAANNREFNEISDIKWKILSVDSVVRGKDHGYIKTDSLAALDKQLCALKEYKIAIFLHHHVLPVGTPLVDKCKLLNYEEFLTICGSYNVKFIGTGHAHILFQRKKNDILISVSPAVCSQWENGTRTVKYVNNSGFSIISFDNNIHVETYFI